MILLQGRNGRKLIKKYLVKKGFNISVVECYKRIFKVIDIFEEVKKWRYWKINTLVVTSSEILKRLDKKVSVFDKNEWLFGCKIFVIGNRLAKIAKEMGWNDIVVSDNANNNDLLKLISKTNDRN
ncbi:uroporphyrinogen-III synthase [Buchnera aphidicola (Rhopalosiphum padi)]|uniref:Uroporphyrinogen-III synthase n=1 Tax=Buchnera aphidicola subsp. Rhopalosiphum padi TaxID=98793 RepID=A0A4D6YKB3_BUCRP|nr:uroporphyrinogen-III synthase [Buchnera aphidicola (Rhopalosiphum padi)]